MSNKGFMLGVTGPFVYDPAKDYRNQTPISDYTSGGTIRFYAAVANTSAPYITDSGNGFVSADLYENAVIEIRGSDDNDGYYLVASVAAGTIQVHELTDFTNETPSAGAVTISTPTQAAYRGLDGTLGSSDETTISDSDNDTSWETERTADDDTLRGKTGGTDRITIDGDGVVITVPLEIKGVDVEQFAYFAGGF